MTEKNLVHELLTKLEEHISGHSFGASPAELYDPITYIMGLGGKRIRPLLSLLAYGMYGKNPTEIFSQAAALEVFILYRNHTITPAPTTLPCISSVGLMHTTK